MRAFDNFAFLSIAAGVVVLVGVDVRSSGLASNPVEDMVWWRGGTFFIV